MDDKPEQHESAEDLEVEDLDVEETDAEAVKGGSGGGGNFDQIGGLKHPV